MTHQESSAAARFRPPHPSAPEQLSIAAPPAVPAGHATAARLLPAAGAVLSVAVTVLLWRSGTGLRSPTMLLLPAGLLLSGGAGALLGGRRGELDTARDTYLHYLSGLGDQAAASGAAQHRALTWRHPDPATLWTLVGTTRMWAPTGGGLSVRIGCATQPARLRLLAPAADPARPADPVTVGAVHRLVSATDSVADLPVALELPPRTALSGDTAAARGLLRAIICGLAVPYGPDVLQITAIAVADTGGHWDWLKWLPHHTPGPVERATRATAATRLLVILDGAAAAGLPTGDGVTVCAVGAASTPVDLELHLGAQEVAVRAGAGGDARQPAELRGPVRPDRLSVAAATACARRLAAHRNTAASHRRDWTALIGIDDLRTWDPVRQWRARPARETLRAPIGTTVAGAPVHIDLNEPAEGGIGPHGLCIGATGSGKSELLRTLVLSLLARHRPEELNLVLVDFKGGATFAEMKPARHVAAVVTNLAADAALVHRLREALTGELTRRQELLRAAGNLGGFTAYRQARRSGARVPPMARLLIVIDEFSEMLSQHPDFAEVFAAVGRLGRSLGVHLLLASQRLEEGRLRGLESHLSYRICLRTLSDGDSRAVLGVPAAHQLPAEPGGGYLSTGAGELIRFQTAFVSAPLPPPATEATSAVRRFTAAAAPLQASPAGPTVLHAVLQRMGGIGAAAHRIWLPPLGRPPALSALLAATGPRRGTLRVPVGVVDRPFQQRRTPLLAELDGAAGNVAVVGGPQSGKSTALCTLIDALAACHDPHQVQFYCLDLGGGALSAVRGLAHVGAVAGRAGTELARCIVAELEEIVADRAARFAEHTITSMAHYRRLRAAADPCCAADRYGDVFLVIDDWAGIRREFAALEEPITALAARGLSVGVHVALSAARWAEIRPGLHDQLGTRLELRLGDPAESEVGRAAATEVPADRPGRGLTRDGLHMLIATPEPPPARPDDAAAPPIRPLPTMIEAAALITAATAARPALGLAERAGTPVTLDFSTRPHLLILGGDECGKTATLRLLCREIVRTHTAGQARLLLVDPRRSLLGVVESPHLAGYPIGAAGIGTALDDLTAVLSDRLPPAQPSQRQLRDRSWWSGPDYYLIVDDYDLIPAGAPAGLLDVLPHARDIGLHLIVARRSGGATRALYEPLLGALRDHGCATLVMGGDPDDGPLIGAVRAEPRPPGRGVLVTRPGDERPVQVAWSPPC